MTATVSFGEPCRRRRPSLTPMIDVVFLLLIFFMLAARFGAETVHPMQVAGGAGAAWEGPPRLVTIAGPERVRLNGTAVAPAELADALRPLMPGPDAPVILRAGPEARLQDVLTVAGRLRAAGIAALVLAR